MNTADIRYGDWTPTAETITENVDATQARKLAATLDRPEDGLEDGAPLPPMWHYIYFLTRAPQSQIGADGHPRRGGFFPPVELKRRMWAGGRTKMHAPLIIGRPATRTGAITALAEKESRQGRLVLATAGYRIEQDGKLCIEDSHDIVYLDGAGSTPPPGADDFTPPATAWHRQLQVDIVTLFRFSALIFNSHRIHYDRDYVTREEGYPGLVVTGPLTAVMLAGHAQMPQGNAAGRTMTGFEFRGRAPLFDRWPFHLLGQAGESGTVDLQAVRNDGVTAMTATATFA